MWYGVAVCVCERDGLSACGCKYEVCLSGHSKSQPPKTPSHIHIHTDQPVSPLFTYTYAG